MAFWSKRLAAWLPDRWQSELKRLHYRRQIRLGRFVPEEPEDALLPGFISPGDWVIDVGANIGHYTNRFSALVGATGRVIAFEPVPVTFSLLASNAQAFAYPNVTLINAAVSDRTEAVSMSLPRFDSGLTNYYQAQISSEHAAHSVPVLTLAIDCLEVPGKIRVIKVDVEGHESPALRGMERLIRRDHPVLIVETSSAEVQEFLHGLGYNSERLPQSPNMLFRPRA